MASLLLRHFSWNKERLIEKYMDNASAISVAAGLALPEKEDPSTSRTRSSQSHSGVRRPLRRNTSEQPKSGKAKILERVTPPADERPFVCPICYDDTQAKTLSLFCGHKFCTDCWNAYVTSKIRTEAEHWITCMAEDCKLVAQDDFVRRALEDDQETFSRFKELVVRHFVSCNNSLKYCPYPSCTYTVSCPAGASKSALSTIVPIVTCGADTSHKFCFGCSVDADHRPVVCAVAKMWLHKCQDDSETANWIKSNTKECSKCQSTIEKNGGCK